MTTEEMLLQLIDGQKQLFDGQKQLFDGQKQLFDGQKQINERLDKMDERFEKIESDLEELKEHAYITREANNALIGKMEAFVKFHNENDARKFKF